jgi:hypothetical protein
VRPVSRRVFASLSLISFARFESENILNLRSLFNSGVFW